MINQELSNIETDEAIALIASYNSMHISYEAFTLIIWLEIYARTYTTQNITY